MDAAVSALIRAPGIRRASVGLAIVMGLLIAGGPARADRLHVQPGGTRVAGPSVPGDWSAANCYADLAGALAAAAPSDSVLCDHAVHAVDEPLQVAVAYLGNRDLSARSDQTSLAFTVDGRLSVPGDQPLTIRGLTFAGDGVLRHDPAVLAVQDGLALQVEGCRFQGFQSQAQGELGGGAVRITARGTLTMTAVEMLSNQVAGRGGGLFLGPGLAAEFVDCLWQGNAAAGGPGSRGGAVMIDDRAAPTVAAFRQCVWRENASDGPGGAIAGLSATVTLEDCEVLDNRSGLATGWSAGPGLHFKRDPADHGEAMSITVRSSRFVGNETVPDADFAAGDGGAILIAGADATRTVAVLVEDSEFRENFALQGAGVYVSRFAEGSVRRCRFIDNIAVFHAGGVFKGGHLYENRGETLTIDQCLFVRNLAGFLADGQPAGFYCRGGAVVSRMFPRVVVRHCTFIDNRIDDPGYHFGDAFAHYFEYGVWEPEMLCVLQNCVFWGADGVDVQAWSSPGGMATAEHNAAAAGQLDLGGVDQVGTVELAAMPFESLETGYPAAGSPLIDAALALGFPVDIDGRPRPQGDGPDIGCHERQVVTGASVPPAAGGTLVASPNPFNPRTVLQGRVAFPGEVVLRIHDARGRVVRTLSAGRLAAGTYRWRWEGRDGDGRPCAAGIYLARLHVDGRTAAVAKLTLVR